MATATTPAVTNGTTTTAISLRPQLVPQIAAIEAIAAQCNLGALNTVGSFQRAFLMAAGIRALKQAITKEMMADLMQLQGSPLGFRTDKDSTGGYPEDVVKDCAIDCALRGGRWVGNEFNIIAGRAYYTKEYFTRMLREFPGLTNLRLSPGVPVLRDGGALVAYSATWSLNGQPDRMDCALVKIDEKTSVDERICVRVNSGMGTDAILGKAERKMKARIYARLTGSDIAEGDAGEIVVRPPARTLDDLSDRVAAQQSPEPAAVPSEDAATPPADDHFTRAAAAFDAATTLDDVQAVWDSLKGVELPAEQDFRLDELGRHATERIKAAKKK